MDSNNQQEQKLPTEQEILAAAQRVRQQNLFAAPFNNFVEKGGAGFVRLSKTDPYKDFVKFLQEVRFSLTEQIVYYNAQDELTKYRDQLVKGKIVMLDEILALAEHVEIAIEKKKSPTTGTTPKNETYTG